MLSQTFVESLYWHFWCCDFVHDHDGHDDGCDENADEGDDDEGSFVFFQKKTCSPQELQRSQAKKPNSLTAEQTLTMRTLKTSYKMNVAQLDLAAPK